MDTQPLHLLECTLRDGSYTIDFQFTAQDTAVIAAALEGAGFDLIEVGHGLGLNASNCGKGVAAATDEEYLQAAASALRRAKWGMFFIPGIGRHEDLELAAKYGMHFVRIGTNATEVDQSREYVEHARNLGMLVSANLMKSYALPPKELARQAQLSASYGSQIICVVDSAGGMMPEDVRAYLSAVRDAVGDVPLGLHCHDNLSLGIANVLAAIESGATYVDSTLQGMGRGGGNPVTEVLVTVLKKRGIDLGIDLNHLMDVGERIIKPMIQERGWDSINITSGYAQFHSSYLQTILKFAAQYQVDARDLIVGVCEQDQVYAPDDLVASVAQRLQREQAGRARVSVVSLPGLRFPHADRAGSLGEAAGKLARDVRAAARKRGRSSVLNVVASQNRTGQAVVSKFLQEEFDFVISMVEVDNPAQLAEVVAAADGVVDVLLVDGDARPFLERALVEEARPLVRKSQLVAYSDSVVWARSVAYEIWALAGAHRPLRVALAGTTTEAAKLAFYLAEQGAALTLTGGPAEKLQAVADAVCAVTGVGAARVEQDGARAVEDAHVLAAFHGGAPVVGTEMLQALPAGAVVFDAGIGAISPEAVAWGVEHEVMMVRPDMRAALAGELTGILGTGRIVSELMGRVEIAGEPVVAGGLIGRRGDVVTDSATNPSRTVGIADGRGRVMPSPGEFEERLARVEAELARRRALLA